MARKGDQEKASCCQSRVHEVLSQAAVQLLYYDDRKNTADHRNPNRNLRRHIQRQDHTRYQGAAVHNGNGTVHQLLIYILT